MEHFFTVEIKYSLSNKLKRHVLLYYTLVQNTSTTVYHGHHAVSFVLHYCIRQIMAHLTPEIIRAYCSNKQLMVFGLRKSQIHKAKVIQRFDCLYFFYYVSF